VHHQALGHLAERQRATTRERQQHERLVPAEREPLRLQRLVDAVEHHLVRPGDRGGRRHRFERAPSVGRPLPACFFDGIEGEGHERRCYKPLFSMEFR
jgi:hypothetical protein